MSTCTPTYEGMPGLIAPVRSTAESEPAREIDKMREMIRKHLLDSFVMRNPAERVLTDLDEVWSEASHEGWNGYGAAPLHPYAYSFAKIFLNALPSTAPLPEVSADADGEVALDWIFGERKALTVSIGPTGRCTFAWILGQRTKNRGTEWIDDEIPEPIISALRRLARATSANQGR